MGFSGFSDGLPGPKLAEFGPGTVSSFLAAIFCARGLAESPGGARFGGFPAGPGPGVFFVFFASWPGAGLIFFSFVFPDSGLFRVREASQRVQDVLLLRKAAPRAREAGSSLPSIKKV